MKYTALWLSVTFETVLDCMVNQYERVFLYKHWWMCDKKSLCRRSRHNKAAVLLRPIWCVKNGIIICIISIVENEEVGNKI